MDWKKWMVDGWMDGYKIDAWLNGQKEKIDGQMEKMYGQEKMDGWMDRREKRWMVGWIDG